MKTDNSIVVLYVEECDHNKQTKPCLLKHYLLHLLALYYLTSLFFFCEDHIINLGPRRFHGSGSRIKSFSWDFICLPRSLWAWLALHLTHMSHILLIRNNHTPYFIRQSVAIVDLHLCLTPDGAVGCRYFIGSCVY